MVEQTILNKLETVGYILLPPLHESTPGYSGLMVLLQQEPKGTNFDPESIHLKIRNWDKTVHWSTFCADTPFPSARKVCPGNVVVFDRSGHETAFFIFGGKLEGTLMPGETLYSLHSEAPVLGLSEQAHSVETQLAIEAEAILAEEQARQRWADQTYWQHLMKIDPFQLYLVCLNLSLKRYEQSTALRRTFASYFAALRKEQRRLVNTGRWPETVPTLGELLH